jgi:uncharacterized membrane protein YsdA (DUF1294 family)
MHQNETRNKKHKTRKLKFKVITSTPVITTSYINEFNVGYSLPADVEQDI